MFNYHVYTGACVKSGKIHNKLSKLTLSPVQKYYKRSHQELEKGECNQGHLQALSCHQALLPLAQSIFSYHLKGKERRCLVV